MHDYIQKMALLYSQLHVLILTQIPKCYVYHICGTFGGDLFVVWQFLIQSPNLMYTNTNSMSIRQGIYIQYHSDCQTKCSSICFALQFAKLNIHQMYHMYSIQEQITTIVSTTHVCDILDGDCYLTGTVGMSLFSFSHLFFFLAILFSQPIMLNILLQVVIFCSKFSYIISYITVTSHTYIPKLYTNIIDSYSQIDSKCQLLRRPNVLIVLLEYIDLFQSN